MKQVTVPIQHESWVVIYLYLASFDIHCLKISQNPLSLVSSGLKSPCLVSILDARVARLLAGKAVGVCFGGGGARGNVHFGVIQAMQELGIPIDVVSGTSFGALAAAMPLVLQGELGWKKH